MTNCDEEFFAFVLIPFNKSFDDVYRLGIKETAERLGIRAERVDEQLFREGILDRIYRQIEIADFIIKTYPEVSDFGPSKRGCSARILAA